MAFPSTPILDDFQRADEGPPPSASWTTLGTTGWATDDTGGDGWCEMSANGSGGAMWETSYGAAQEVYYTLRGDFLGSVAADAYLTCVLLAQGLTYGGADRHFDVEFYKRSGTDNVQLWERDGGTWTQRGSTTSLGSDLADLDELGAGTDGTTITVYRNGTSTGLTYTPGSHPSGGYIGFYATDWNFVIDDFGGGNAAAPKALPLARHHSYPYLLVR